MPPAVQLGLWPERLALMVQRRKSWSVRQMVLQLFSQGRAEPKVPTARFDLNRRPCCWRRGLRIQEVKKNPPRRGDLRSQGPCSPHLLWVPEGREGVLPAPERAGLC